MSQEIMVEHGTRSLLDQTQQSGWGKKFSGQETRGDSNSDHEQRREDDMLDDEPTVFEKNDDVVAIDQRKVHFAAREVPCITVV